MVTFFFIDKHRSVSEKHCLTNRLSFLHFSVYNYVGALSLGFVAMLGGFPGGSDGKASAYNAGDLGSIPGSGRSGEGNGNPLQYSCLEKCYGQKRLVGYSSRGCKELDTTEQLN